MLGTVLVLGVGLVVYYFLKHKFDDEPPIRVHNGSMVIETVKDKGSFKPEAGDADDNEASYSHETTTKNASKDVYAYVYPTTSCTANLDLKQPRNEIVVTYHVDAPPNDRDFTFKRGQRAGVFATKIRPVKEVDLDPLMLTYAKVVSGYISKVELRGQGQPASCTFTAAEKKQVQIAICPSTGCRY